MLVVWVPLLLLYNLNTVYGEYVRLLKPVSRISEKDVLLQRNAESPCPSIRSSKDTNTIIPNNGEYDIVWANPSSIQGENRVELLNSNMQLITVLKPLQNHSYSTKNGVSTLKVQIPNTECLNCIVRLVQTTATGDFQIISCADVDIKKSYSDIKECYGDECLVECTSDSQCKKGVCLQGACYCNTRFYGINCSKENKLITTDEDIQNTFAKISLQNKNSLSWSIDKENITLVLKFPTNTWTAIGISSPSVQKQCEKLKEIIRSNAIPQSIQASTTQLVDSTPIGPIGICAENEQFSHCPELNRECEPSCDWTAFPESIPTCPRSCGAPRCLCKEGFVRSGNNKDLCVPFSICQEEVKVECQRNETWAKCGQACEPSCSTMYDTKPCTDTCLEEKCTCIDNYVRHESKCIHWGECPNLEQRMLGPPSIKTKDNLKIEATSTHSNLTNEQAQIGKKSTTISLPTISETPGSPIIKTNENMQCAINETVNECGTVCEADCITIFIRDECKACGTPACSCLSGYARYNNNCVYWGDCPLDLSLQAFTSTKPDEKILASTIAASAKLTTSTAFTTFSDEHKENFNSSELIDSLNTAAKNNQDLEVSGDYCYGEWRYPPNCKFCDYKISWNFVEETDEIEFSLETKIKPNSWTGIGFSSLGGMRDADLIILKSLNGKISLHDMYSNSYDAPMEDFDNNIKASNIIGSHTDGVVRAQFTRKRDTGDRKMDHKFSDQKCYKFLFPTHGGKLDENGNIIKHEVVPFVTNTSICIKSCQEKTAEESRFLQGACLQEFRYPTGCKLDKCEYVSSWHYNSSKSEVYFEITSRGIGRWTGIGFSKDGNMAASDIYTGWVYGNKAYVSDRFAYGRQLPAIDPADRQDIYDIGGKIADDYQTIWFKRKVVTSDKTTDFPLNDCYFFMFPVGGGRVLARKSQDFKNSKTPIGYHDLYAPKVSQTKICICDEFNNPIGFNNITPPAVRKRRETLPPDPFAENIELASNIHIRPIESTVNECMDVIVAKVMDTGHSRVVDAFSLSKKELEPDEFFGGNQTFTEILASASNGIATVILRRPLISPDASDYSFRKEQAKVFWANGPIGATSVKISEAIHEESVLIDFFESKHTTIGVTKQKPITFESTSSIKTTTNTTIQSSTSAYKISNEQETFLPIDQKLAINKFPKINSESDEDVSQLLAVSSNPFAETSTFSIDHCYGYFNYPTNCQIDCSYQVDWRSDGNNVMFRLHAVLYPQMWTGIGFSKDGSMINSDAVIISIYKDSTIAVTDQFASNYGRPKVDSLQDIFDVSTYYSNGQLWTNFSRSLTTEDTNDLNLLECQYFVFIQSGGQLEGGTSEIRKHIETPIHSSTKICFNNCKSTNGTDSTSSIAIPTHQQTTTTVFTTHIFPLKSTPIPKTIKKENVLLAAGTLQVPPLRPPYKIASYDVIIRLLNKEYSSEFEDMESKKSKTLSQEINKELTALIKSKWPSLESISVLKFAKGSILSLLRLEFNSTNSDPIPKEDEIETFLKEAAKKEYTSLAIDPINLKVQRNLNSEESNKWAPLKDIRNWAIVICALILLTIIVCLLLCCSFRRPRNKVQADPLSFAPPIHKGYPSYSYGYPGMVNDSNLAQSKDTGSKNKVTPNLTKKPQDTQNVNNNSPNANEPNGIGNCTYQEWYNKVASKNATSHLQENSYNPMGMNRPISRTSAQSSMSPYVSYPHDPIGYYTLGGEHRLPPPSYYRHY